MISSLYENGPTHIRIHISESCTGLILLSISGLDVNRIDLKGGSSGGSSHDGSSCSHHSASDLISQCVDGQYLTTEVGRQATLGSEVLRTSKQYNSHNEPLHLNRQTLKATQDKICEAVCVL